MKSAIESKSRPLRATAALLAMTIALPLVLPLPAHAQRSPEPDRSAPPETGQRSPQLPAQREPRANERDPLGPQSGNRPSSKKGAEAAPPKPIPKNMRPPGVSSVPHGGSERAKLLDELYANLATAEDETVAGRIAAAIEHVWMASGSDTVNLLMERARRASAEKKPELALRLMDRAAQLSPDFPEVFNTRGAIHFSQNNLSSAVGDLRRVLALEPNHYKALETLAQIFKEMGRKKAALEMYRKLNQIHPLMAGTKTALDELEREVNGQAS
jgi:tetratricopeptide (TPR) repeat protein